MSSPSSDVPLIRPRIWRSGFAAIRASLVMSSNIEHETAIEDIRRIECPLQLAHQRDFFAAARDVQPVLLFAANTMFGRDGTVVTSEGLVDGLVCKPPDFVRVF